MAIVRNSIEPLLEYGDPTSYIILFSVGTVIKLVGLAGTKKVESPSIEAKINSFIQNGDFQGALSIIDNLSYVPEDVKEKAKAEIMKIAAKYYEHQKMVQEWNQHISDLVGQKRFGEAISFVRGLDLPTEERARVAGSIEKQKNHLDRVERFLMFIDKGDFREALKMIDSFDNVPKEKRKTIKKELRTAWQNAGTDSFLNKLRRWSRT